MVMLAPPEPTPDPGPNRPADRDSLDVDPAVAPAEDLPINHPTVLASR
jgi:hypothetical protein